jgi:tetratricopeptide (TPR) repeat protein
MKISTKSSVRQKIIFFLMITSVIGFVIDYNLNFKVQVEPVKSNELNVNSLLIDTVGFSVINPKYDRVVDEKMPSEIFLYLEGYAANIQTNKEIIIFEIIDKVDTQEKIKKLVAEGDLFFKEDKLTSPIGSNAFERYESALTIDAENKDAIAGIKKIVNRYLSLADTVIKKNEIYKVTGLVKNAYKVSSDYFDISLQIKKYSPYIKDESIFLGQSNLNNKTLTSINKILIDDNAKVSANNNASSTSNIRDVDSKTAYIAKKLADQEYIYGAIKVLESFSSVSDYWGDSYNLLLGLYLKAAMDKDAESLVFNNKSLDLFQFAEKVAHIFVARDDVAGAIHLLEGHKPTIDGYQDYYSLKAGLYYETGDYTDSSTLYRKLLHVDYTNPIYWLGLAVSLDKLEDGKALQAFHYADYYSGKTSDVKRYIENNIILVSIY